MKLYKNSLFLDNIVLRIGLLGTASVLFKAGADLWAEGLPFVYSVSVGLSFAAWFCGIIASVQAMIMYVDRRSEKLILAGLIFAQLAYVYLSTFNRTPLIINRTDNEMIAQFAAEALKRGQNPYTWNFSDMLRVYRDRGVNFTPLLDGAYQNRVTYPALPTLLFAGLGWFNVGEVRVIGIFFHLILLVMLFFGAPRPARPLILLPLFLFKDFVFMTSNGVQDIVWSTLLVVMLLVWKRPLWRAVLFGLACAYRQQPWLIAPFLLIALWHTSGSKTRRLRRIVTFAGISGGIFLLINSPFIIWDLQAWWMGAFEPIYASFNIYSYGLAALSHYGLANLPRSFYTALQFSSLLAMLMIHWRHPRTIGKAFWMFPALFFWFYYRSLTNYWVYWIPPLLLSLTRMDVTSLPEVRYHRTVWGGTGAIITVLVLPIIVWGAILSHRPPTILVSHRFPVRVIEYGKKLVDRLEVTVVNVGESPLKPRFAVQRDPAVQALPWDIVSGPRQLASKQSGDYVIEARIPVRAFPVERGGQLVVTHAGTDYTRRIVHTIPPEITFTDPDGLVNPAFRVWPRAGRAPESWELRSTGNSASAALLDTVDNRNALLLQLSRAGRNDERAELRLAQTITFPAPFNLWVYPTGSLSDPDQEAYGVEIADGNHTLRILFGSETEIYRKRTDIRAEVLLPAPLKTWSCHTLDLSALYAMFGWSLPPATPRYRDGLAFPASQVEFSLLLISDSRRILGVFGPIEQMPGEDFYDVDMAAALDYPADYYVNVGDNYRRQRNYDLAQGAYKRALTYEAHNAAAHFGYAETAFWLGDWEAAERAFTASLDAGYHQPALAHRGLGWAHYNQADYNAARRDFEAAAKFDATLADAHNGLGWVEIQSDNCISATVHFEHALRLAPELFESQHGLDVCAMQEAD